MDNGTVRYQVLRELTGQQRLEICDILSACFLDVKALEDFVEQQFGLSARQSVNWNQAFSNASYDFVSSCGPDGKIGALLLALELRDSTSKSKITELIGYLVDAGYLQDQQKPQRKTTNPYKTDWMARYPTDHCVVQGDARNLLLDALAGCFGKVADIEGFLQDNFPCAFGRQVANGIDRNKAVREVLEGLIANFERICKLTAFVLAVVDYYNDPDFMMLHYLAQRMLSLGKRQAPSAAAPVAGQTGQAVTAQGSPAAAAPAAKAGTLTVLSFAGDLSHELQLELSAILVRAFDRNSMSRFVRLSLGEHLDHIVATQASLNKVGEDLIKWCVEKVKLAILVNAMLEAQPNRVELRDFVRRLAGTGELKLAE